MATLHTSTVPLGGNSIRVRLLDLYGEARVDIRRFDYATPSHLGFCLDMRHLPAIRKAVAEAEQEARNLDLITDDDD